MYFTFNSRKYFNGNSAPNTEKKRKPEENPTNFFSPLNNILLLVWVFPASRKKKFLLWQCIRIGILVCMHFFSSKNGLFTPCLLAQALVVVSFFIFHDVHWRTQKTRAFAKKSCVQCRLLLVFRLPFTVHTQLLLLMVESFSLDLPISIFVGAFLSSSLGCCCRCCCWWCGVQKTSLLLFCSLLFFVGKKLFGFFVYIF